MIQKAIFYTFLTLVLLTFGQFPINPQVHGQGQNLEIGVDTPSITINASKEGDPNSFFVEKLITFTIMGDIKDPVDPSKNAIAYLQMGAVKGVLAMVLDENPYKSGVIPYQTTLRLGIYKSSHVGSGSVEFSVASRRIVRTIKIPVTVKKENISVQLNEPEPGMSMYRPNIWFNGSVSQAVPGVEVCLEIYHKKPEFITDEQKMGKGSGIVVSGFTLTDQRGRFALNGDYLAFYNPMGLLAGNQMIDLKSLTDGTYWLIYYVSGRVLQPNLYANADVKNLTNIEIGSANELYQPTVTRDPNTYLYGDQMRTFNIQAVTHSLTVLCKDSSGNKISGAKIGSTKQPNGQTPLNGVTSATTGSVTFKNILPGTYTIKGSWLFLGDIYEGWDTVTTVAGEDRVVTIKLINEEDARVQIPGYPYESIIIGIAIISIFIWRSKLFD